MITAEQIEDLTSRDEFRGFGYLGSPYRRNRTDLALAAAANTFELTIDEVFLWANSVPARHFADTLLDHDGDYAGTVDAIMRELQATLPVLQAEQEGLTGRALEIVARHARKLADQI